ncbi:16S rRNA processing protein RimM [Litorimonas taeanensis]|uniref:Ribosome maturation factor RimM n=1 Tax=Litorimonas taeanensis TaxID=568099 RepID=A0A420WDP8_9PROT|nr:ribosome maturation factor RimM [Litorimonas taeanensis]RKQ69075.1 16S rRNA processing protein RimM [Litorimonas taeanensis]
MTKIQDNELICVAAIAGAFGVKGEVKLKPFTEFPEGCVSYGPLLSDKGSVVITPISYRVMKDFVAVTAEEVSSREQAESLKSTKLYISRDVLPEPDEDDFYYSDLIGLEVKSTDGKRIGEVIAIHEFGAGDMIEIAPFPDKKNKKSAASFFHPFTKLATPKVDLERGRLIIVPQLADEG